MILGALHLIGLLKSCYHELQQLWRALAYNALLQSYQKYLLK